MAMKTMLKQRLNNSIHFILVLLLCLVSSGLKAVETKWEVGIVFRGNSEDEQFQKDVDKNILELTRLNPNANFKIGIYREINGKSYAYSPNEKGTTAITLSDLLYRQDLNKIDITGNINNDDNVDLTFFLKNFYKDPKAKKALIIYSHGKGAEGLRGLSTKELSENLSNAPHLDLLWFDACFMANLEFLYEMKNASDYTIASEEAEFASGLPFQQLSQLSGASNGKDAAMILAKTFIESYSYLKNGSQRNYVSVSSATISVIENKNLEGLTQSMKNVSAFYKNLSTEQQNKMIKTLQKTAVMDNTSMIDLGVLLIELRKLNKTPVQDHKLTEMIRLLNIEAVKKLKTNPRIHLSAPNGLINTQMIFGFNNWTVGNKKDFSEGEIFSSLLKNDGFSDGPRNMQWPLKKVKAASDLVITPFAPGINIFNYYFINAIDGKLLTEAQSVSRTHDIVESFADSKITPIVYFAYTQQVGSKAERYTGINITMPGTIPSLDYYELKFNSATEWLSL
jgi:Clostripain family